MRLTEPQWDTVLVLSFHALLLLLLGALLLFVIPTLGLVFPKELGAPLPWALRQLVKTPFPTQHPILVIPFALAFLWADTRIYMTLCARRGKRAGTLWALGVAVAISLAIVWFGFLFVASLSWMAEGQKLYVK